MKFRRNRRSQKNERSTASQKQIAAAMAYEDLFVKGLFKEWTIRIA
jgi:hypothetical protein